MKTIEIWKDVKGYEGLYQVSNLGNVKTFSWGREKLLKPNVVGAGYSQVCLSKDKKRKMYLVHRLVGLAFIPNPNNLETIDHIDEDKTNNRVENLQWLSRADNASKSNTGAKHSQWNPDSLYNKCCRLYEKYQEIQGKYKNAKSFYLRVYLNSKPAVELYNKYK